MKSDKFNKRIGRVKLGMEWLNKEEIYIHSKWITSEVFNAIYIGQDWVTMGRGNFNYSRHSTFNDPGFKPFKGSKNDN